MSPDSDPIPPDDTGIRDRIPEEPLLAEPPEVALPRRRRLADLPWRQGPPHPGFWWAVLWCILMLIVCQVLPAIGVVIVALVVMVVRSMAHGAEQPDVEQLQRQILLPTVAISQIALIAFSLLVLRLIVGPDWARQVALRRPAVKHIVLAIVLWPALAITASGIYQGAQILPPLGHILSYLVSGCATVAVLGVLWCIIRIATGQNWLTVLANQPARIQLAVAPVVCLAAFGIGATAFSFLDPHLWAFDSLDMSLMKSMVKEFRAWPPALGVLIVGLGPGLGEELWCRAFLGRGFVGRYGVVLGVVLASFFFGAIHGDPHQGTMAAIMGLALHFSYLMTRSLVVPMLLHFLNNSLDVVADKLPDLPRQKLENLDTNPEAIPLQVLLASGFLLAAVCWAFYTSRARLVRVDGSGEPPWQPAFPGVAHPPPGSGTAVVLPWPGVWPTLAVVAGIMALGAALYWF